MSFGAPAPPDPTTTANTQQTFNAQAAQKQNQINSYNQSGPTGSMSYVADPNSPSGYTLSTNPGSYGTPLFGAATSMAGNSAGMYSQPFNLDAATGATAKTLNDWSANYLNPIYQQQDSNLEAQLRNQGLNPGTEAYDNAKNLLARNQGDTTNQYLQQNEGQAFGQTLQNYQLPLQTIQQLIQTGSPTGFQQTPTSQDQPANYAGLVQQNYQTQNQNYENMLSGMFGIGTGLAGGWAKGAFGAGLGSGSTPTIATGLGAGTGGLPFLMF